MRPRSVKLSLPDPANGQPLIKSTNLFPVVGVGAAAGGLKAFEEFLTAIPGNSGMAFILVQHLDPNIPELLPELLQKYTTMPVEAAIADVVVQPDHVYIIPGNKLLTANDGILQLSQRRAGIHLLNLPIDLFFTSLAEVHEAHAIGVVLSGMARDGTQGLRAIKNRGGITFAQDVESAVYDGMPGSAAMAGVVDFILPPNEMPATILEITRHYKAIEQDEPMAEQQAYYNSITRFLQDHFATDFSWYQEGTIRKWIHRRMAIHKTKLVATYFAHLQGNKKEQEMLNNDLKISFSYFFNDREVFDGLCREVFPRILQHKSSTDQLRIWVVGCITGEEAYSIAICLREFLNSPAYLHTLENDNRAVQKVQIFATDISEVAIAKARTGLYTKTELKGLAPEKLQQFFANTGYGYRVNKTIRDMCVFARHNYLEDAPYSRMDFICCREVIIHTSASLQKKALEIFHYALKENGLLLLGNPENTGSAPHLFSGTGNINKLFIRNEINKSALRAPIQALTSAFKTSNHIRSADKGTNYKKIADELILTNFIPAGIVVNAAMDIVHFRGPIGSFIEMALIKTGSSLVSTLDKHLSAEILLLIKEAAKERIAVTKENLAMVIKDRLEEVKLEVIPLFNTVDPHYLVLFHAPAIITGNQKGGTSRQVANQIKKNQYQQRIVQLESELAQTRQDMHVVSDQQETVNEELQSANEELQSGSEELLSLNEELENGKEELEATNEEVIYINNALTHLNEQLTIEKSYNASIIATIREPLLVLDKNFIVKSANQSFYDTFKVNDQETVGVLIYDLGNRHWDIPLLHTLLEETLPQKRMFSDVEVTHTFPGIGERVIQLNGSEITREREDEKLILLSIQDITVKALIHLQEIGFQKQLEEKVLQRTRELNEANGMLLVKNEELAKANVELESFSYVSSHDLQEPLRKIKTFATLVLEKEKEHLSETGKDYLRRMQKAATRMKELIEDLLDFAHTNSRNETPVKSSLDKIMQDVVAEFTEVIHEKKATIEYEGLGTAIVNQSQFRQLLTNLLSNALKFSREGITPHILVKTRTAMGSLLKEPNLVPEKEYCHISVTDNGIGFDPQYKERIFQVFQRLNGRDAYPGTGIGLAIVKKIIDNHGGFISANSEIDEGATFNIYIPAF